MKAGFTRPTSAIRMVTNSTSIIWARAMIGCDAKDDELMTSYHLIGHRLCPYVQRVAMVLAQNGITHKRTDIVLDAKPDWFLGLSPTGNVPVLVVDDGRTLFEAAAICQYLEAIAGKSPYATDAYDLAFAQGVVAIGDKLLSLTADMIYRDLSENSFDATMHQIHKQMSIVSGLVLPQALGAGKELSMLDIVFATVFRPFAVIAVALNRDLFAGFPGLRGWASDLAKHETVRNAVPATYYRELHEFIACKGGYLANRLRMIPQDNIVLAPPS
ncbi:MULTISPECIES: glutathione S-transferase family protein [unclassified Thalassospira]|uniref:glutathione S-transferase family protein n=1 Tax=unclassified Thalassospira TaxID=2648997 RepID=UPI001B0FA7AE|nr:glutathione S-transferase family protein [Thalassospira sp.]MBO6772140.1 glutathione S-transferase family protein [Thalassospira sp.]